MVKKTASKVRLLGRVLIVLAILCAVLHIGFTLIATHQPASQLARATPMFDLDNEHNVPAAFTGMLLGMAVLAAFVLATKKDTIQHKINWFLLSAFFLYLGFDELVGIHEQTAEGVRKLLNIKDGSFLYHAWILPVLLVVIAVGAVIFLLRNRKKLITKQQKHILFTLGILIVGDVLLESLGTQAYAHPLLYKLGPVLLEEMFEIGMISYVLYRLVGYND